jgi:hypothetical protein
MATPDSSEGELVNVGKGLRWKSIVVGWLVAAITGLLVSPLLRSLYGIAAPPPLGRGDFTAGLVTVSLVSGFLAYLVGGYVAARIARRFGGLHGAMIAVFGLVVGIVLTLVLTPFGAIFVEGVAAPPVGFGLARQVVMTGGLPLFLVNVFGGYVGGKLGEPSEPPARRNG